MYRPLADDIRPTTLDDVVGQKHILGPNGMLRRIVASGEIPNMVFYGPSGTGKTTVARIIAKQAGKKLYQHEPHPAPPERNDCEHFGHPQYHRGARHHAHARRRAAVS